MKKVVLFAVFFTFLLVFSAFSVCGAVENFLSYTEVDEANDITRAGSFIVMSSMSAEVLSYVYYDYGVSHFDNFEHDVTGYCDECESNGVGLVIVTGIGWWDFWASFFILAIGVIMIIVAYLMGKR